MPQRCCFLGWHVNSTWLLGTFNEVTCAGSLVCDDLETRTRAHCRWERPQEAGLTMCVWLPSQNQRLRKVRQAGPASLKTKPSSLSPLRIVLPAPGSEASILGHAAGPSSLCLGLPYAVSCRPGGTEKDACRKRLVLLEPRALCSVSVLRTGVLCDSCPWFPGGVPLLHQEGSLSRGR